MTLKDTANYLEMSTRTLQRKLSGHKTSWSELTELSPLHTAPYNHTQANSDFSSADDPGLKTGGGTLDEDAIERAIAQALINEPLKALPIAINWMAKKGRITLETDGKVAEEMQQYYNEVLNDVYADSLQ